MIAQKNISSDKLFIPMSHIILKYPYYYMKVVSELYKSSRKSYFLPTENRKYRLFSPI